MHKPARTIEVPTSSGRSGYPALSILERGLILAVAVAQFLIGHGRVWAKPFDWDRSIIWSYVTIVGLVPIALLLRRRFTPVGWLLHAVELMSVKFLLTASFLVGFLIMHPPGSPAADAFQQLGPAPEGKARSRARAEPTVFPEGLLSDIRGQVIGADRKPARAALVFVSEGFSGFTFQPPTEPVSVQNDGTGFFPALAAIQTGQPLFIRSANHQLHTVQMVKHDRSWVLNVPLLGSGEARELEFEEAKGLVSLECKVHQSREAPGHLVILNHPFFAFTDSEGRFLLRGVPSGKLTLSAFDPGEGQSSLSIHPDPGAKVNIRLQLGVTAR